MGGTPAYLAPPRLPMPFGTAPRNVPIGALLPFPQAPIRHAIPQGLARSPPPRVPGLDEDPPTDHIVKQEPRDDLPPLTQGQSRQLALIHPLVTLCEHHLPYTYCDMTFSEVIADLITICDNQVDRCRALGADDNWMGRYRGWRTRLRRVRDWRARNDWNLYTDRHSDLNLPSSLQPHIDMSSNGS